jgi:hypothetical protein
MIYLIDEKLERQQNLGWTRKKLDGYKEILMPIYNNTQLQKEKKDLFAEGNAILFHESFFDDPVNKHNSEVADIGQTLSSYSSKNSFPIVRFSGSMGSRRIDKLIATMPFLILYQNLAIFLEAYQLAGEISLKKLAFGTTDLEEEILIYKSEIYRSLYDKKDEDNLTLNPTINRSLMQLEKITKIKVMTTGITNGCLKRQLETI